jgi:hypothetical protein
MMGSNAGPERRDSRARLTAVAGGLLLLLALPCTAAAESDYPGAKSAGQRMLDGPPTLQPPNSELQTLLQQLHQAAQYCDQETYDKLVQGYATRLNAYADEVRQTSGDESSLRATRPARLYIAYLNDRMKECAEFRYKRYVFATGATEATRAKLLDQKAERSAKDCREAIAEAEENAKKKRREAAERRERAQRVRQERPTIAAERERSARELDAEADAWEAFAADLKKRCAERSSAAPPSGAGPAEGPPGPPLPRAPEAPRDVGAVPGRLTDLRNRPRFAVGGTFGNVNVPSFGAGTQFNVALGREVSILLSPRNLRFAGGTAEFRAPVSSVFGADVPSPFSQMAFYAKLEGYSFWGSESATVPFGGNNVAYTYLFPNPATGTTGVLAGPSGQDISIKANGEAIRFRAGAEWQVSLADLRTAYAIISGGLAFDYTDSGYEITQQSLFFPDISSRTKLRVDDYFFAPYIGAGVRLDDGNIFASVSGFVAPGLLLTDASAKQRNLCGPCPNPGDRNFKLRSSLSNTRFAVQTGVDLRLGARLTPSVAIEGGIQYVHTSHSGFLRPPTTPTEQPVRLDYGSTNRFGGRIGVRFTF